MGNCHRLERNKGDMCCGVLGEGSKQHGGTSKLKIANPSVGNHSMSVVSKALKWMRKQTPLGRELKKGKVETFLHTGSLNS